MTCIQIKLTNVITNQMGWERKDKAIPLMSGAIFQAQFVIFSRPNANFQRFCTQRG